MCTMRIVPKHADDALKVLCGVHGISHELYIDHRRERDRKVQVISPDENDCVMHRESVFQ